MWLICRSTVVAVLLLGFIAISGWAGEANIESDGSGVWKAGVDGVEIEWNVDGSVKRIYSRYGMPVEVADRRGIKTAQIIAEEKAKAAIIRFMNQSVSSKRIVTEVENDLSKATQKREGAAGEHVKKVDERTVLQNLTQITSSFASGNLKGVIVLEQGYDGKSEEAWVVVGISEKTIKAAQTIREMANPPARVAPPQATPSPEQGNNDSPGTQPSEVRRSNQKSW
jgi:hypothetical protein